MKKILTLLLLLTITKTSNACIHSAKISSELIVDKSYNITITIYHDSIPINSTQTGTVDWGDGIIDTVHWIGGNYLMTIYSGDHTYSYSAQNYYTITFTEPNRCPAINNIPSSSNNPLIIEANIYISPFVMTNSSPVFLYVPSDTVCYCQTFISNLGAFDADGDSLSYHLVPCIDVVGYLYPTGFTINSTTGDFTWNCPSPIGRSSVAIVVREWRKLLGVYTVVGSTMFDFTLYVSSCSATIEENKFENAMFNIFPNPSTNELNIAIVNNSPNSTIKVYDLLGSLKVNSLFKDKNYKTDISDWTAGVYIIEVGSGNKISRQKFIKQ